MKAKIHVRVGIAHQEEGTSTETQEARCRRAAEQAGYEVDPGLIRKEQRTAIDLDRTGLNLGRQAARAGLISALFVCMPEGRSRDSVHLIMLLDELLQSGGSLHSVEEISYYTPEGELLMHVQGHAAERERARILERSMRAEEEIAKSGRMYMMTGFSACQKCGAPLLGSSLRKGRYRYYRCPATVPISTGPAACDALSIPADEFEDAAWRTLTAAIRELVSELLYHSTTGGVDIGEEMASLRREILHLRGWPKRLLDLFQEEYVDEDLPAGQIGPPNALRDEKEGALTTLEDQQRHKGDAAEVERRIVEVCRQVQEKLDNMDSKGKRPTLAAFGVKVQATREEISMTVIVEPK